jgi:hypothetical protein
VSRRLPALLLIAALLAGAYVLARTRRDFWDFEVYRTAASRLITGAPLYQTADGHYQFKYWPAFAAAMVPFALLPAEVAKVAWYVLSIALMVLFIRLSIARLPDRQRSWRLLGWMTLLVTAKFLVKELVNGQTNTLMGVLALAALIAATAGHRRRAGILVGLAAFAKPYALILAIWLLVTQGVAAAAWSIAVVLAGLAAPALRYGWHGNLTLLTGWFQTVATTTPDNLLLAENVSLATMWAKWIGPSTAANALTAVSTVGLMAAAGWIVARRSRVRQPAYLEVSALLLIVPLLSPQGWDYVLLLGIPAFVCLIDRFPGMPRPWQAVTCVGFALTSFTIFDLLGRTLYLRLMARSVVSVGALLLVASVVQLRARAAA